MTISILIYMFFIQTINYNLLYFFLKKKQKKLTKSINLYKKKIYKDNNNKLTIKI